MAEQQERLKEKLPSAPLPASDATAASVKKWADRFAATRVKISATTVVEDAGKLLNLLQAWPQDYDHGSQEHTDASQLKGTLTALKNKLLNLLEQVDRQMIILDALTKGLGDRKILGVVAGDRLEAVCIWTIITGTGEKEQEKDANWWHPAWKRTLYVPELTSAPWNVGWPTHEHGVSGAGTSLVNAMKEKGKAEGCDGIGLVGLACNLDFYKNVGFKSRPGSDLGFIMDLPK